jgi:hypothetical protein
MSAQGTAATRMAEGNSRRKKEVNREMEKRTDKVVEYCLAVGAMRRGRTGPGNGNGSTVTLPSQHKAEGPN